MDLDSREDSLDDCTQEVIDFTNKGKKISMISLVNKNPNPKTKFEAQRISAIGYGFGSSMRGIQKSENLTKNLSLIHI